MLRERERLREQKRSGPIVFPTKKSTDEFAAAK